MATAPPTGGEWRAWYARLCQWSDQYHDRADDAGRCARRLVREMDSLRVLLAHEGVEPINNRAEVRFVGQKLALFESWRIGPKSPQDIVEGHENLVLVSV